MAPAQIDLNSDLGEGFGQWTLGDDDALLDVVTSANVACGFHASDATIMRRVCARAVQSGVAIGAQVGYRDLPGFGRRFIDVEPEALTADVVYQLGALEAFARIAGDRVRYVKPHGALYNRIVHDERQANAVVDAVAAFDPALALLGMAGSAIERAAAEAGLRFVREAFVDRGYRADGTLVPRTEPGALLSDESEIADRAVRMVTDGVVVTVDGGEVTIEADSLCVHGDTPGAVAMAVSVRGALAAAGIGVEPFA